MHVIAAAAALLLLIAAGVIAQYELCGQTLSPGLCFQNVAPCSSPVFCSGSMLQLFQYSGLFNDSKTYVDAPLRAPESVVAYMFQSLLPSPNTSQLAAFYAQWFLAPGSDLVPVTPADWTATPTPLATIADSEFQAWAVQVNALWKTLTFAVNESVALNPTQHTLLYLPEPFVVPGDRFREPYYWDAYWTVKGLLAVNMSVTAEGILENFFHLVQTLGNVPNGAREYYTDRSQPPMLTQMVWDYYQYSGNLSFLSYALPALEAEYDYWMDTASVTLPGGATVNQYVAQTGMPRPEGYTEDMATAQGIYNPTARACVFSEIASIAASGWDFSSRWLADSLTLQSACVRSLAPIDLNAIMYKNEVTLSQISALLQHPTRSYYFSAAAARRLDAIESLFWSEELGLYVDLNVTSMAPAAWITPYAAAIVPLWAGSYSALNSSRAATVIDTLTNADFFSFPGGVPTSLFFNPALQWDMPNAWAPLQWFMIEGLAGSGLPEAIALSTALTSTWLSSNLAAFTTYGYMFEKYDARQFGQPGGLGEYAPQTGFAWTNGVVLDLLVRYPNTPRVSTAEESGRVVRAAAEALRARSL